MILLSGKHFSSTQKIFFEKCNATKTILKSNEQKFDQSHKLTLGYTDVAASRLSRKEGKSWGKSN